MHKTESKFALKENPELLRNFQNYAHDVEKQNLSSTGLKENCIWNTLEDFHFTTNYSVDVMHDLFEGVCIYDMTFLLRNLIFDLQLFDLDTLNSRLNCFNYGDLESSNKPSKISNDALTKKKMRMSASEMLFFLDI